MKEKMRRIRRNTFTLCVIFVFCIVLFAFVPHFHECSETNCAVCEFISAAQKSLIGIAMALLAYVFVSVLDTFVSFPYFTVSPRDMTPVGRKVKLSD